MNLLKPSTWSRPAVTIALSVIFIVLYQPVVWLAMSLAIEPGNVSPVYPPAGLSLAAALLLGRRIWPAILVADTIGNFTLLFDSARIVDVILCSLSIGGAELVSCIIALEIIRKLHGSKTCFTSTKGVLIFLLASFIWAVNPTIGVSSLVLFNFLPVSQVETAMLTWWLGDVIGILVFTPPLLLAGASMFSLYGRSYKEALLQGAVTVVCLYILFHIEYPLIFLLLPLVLWAAIRFRAGGASLSLMLISTGVILPELFGYSLFSGYGMNERLLLLQCFTGVSVITGYLIAAVVSEYDLADRRLKQKSRLASLGSLATATAHEINQPLQVIGMSSDMIAEMLKEKKTDDVWPLLEYIDKQVNRIGAITSNLREFGGMGEDQSGKSVNRLADLLHETIELVDGRRQQLKFRLELYLPEEQASVVCNHIRMVQVFTNLILNAADALVERYGKPCNAGLVEVRVLLTQKTAEVQVIDNARGIEESQIEHIFEPFFTTKGPHGGTGLGLSISENIVRENGGTLSVVSKRGEGSTFIVRLPRHS